MLFWLLALFLAFAPGLVLLWYIRHIDRFEPEPWGTVWRAFLAGCLSVIPALAIEWLLHKESSTVLSTAYQAFIVAALTEEVCKGGAGMLAIWRRPEFNEVMDGIVYFGVAHMGFAITENLTWIFIRSGGEVQTALMTGFVRTTTAVPLHVINGMIMGFELGMARYAKNWRQRLLHIGKAILYPVLLHGFYDVFVMNEVQIHTMTDLIRAGFGAAGMYAMVAVLWMVLLPRVREAQDVSPFRPHDSAVLAVAPEACTQCGAAYPSGANFCHMCGTAVVAQQSAPGS
ncbi:MAG: PrsW family glutamic-type intramembrane protease [Mycobacterium leprae]